MKKNLKIAIIGLSGKSLFFEVEKFHGPGETIIANNIHLEPGGKGYNQAAHLLKLGARVAYLTTVGDDEYGKTCFDYLNQKTASLYFKKIENEKTATASILINKNGENQVTVYQGASKYLNLNHLKEFATEIKTADALLLTLELPLEIVIEAIKIASKNNVLVILNPAPYNQDFRLYNLCDFIIPNEIEARQIFKLDALELNKALADLIISEEFSKNYKNVIITTGNKGCTFINKQKDGKYIIDYIKGINVAAIDTTGAGDIFCASFTYFYLLIKDYVKALHYANIAAAISTKTKFVLNSLPNLEDILNFKKV